MEAMDLKTSEMGTSSSEFLKLPEGISGNMSYEMALEVFRACLQSADREIIYVPDELCREFDINPIKENGGQSLKEVITRKPKTSTRERLLQKLEDRKK